jgi:WD40 repeat protein
MAKGIALGLSVVFLVWLIQNTAVSCFDWYKPKGYVDTCATLDCQVAISYCVNLKKCMGIKPCQNCIIDYPFGNCGSACGDNLFDQNEYLYLTGSYYLPCDPAIREQVAACALHCRGHYLTGSSCSSLEGRLVCKCFNNEFSITSSSSSTATSASQTTTETAVVTSASNWANIILDGHSNKVNCIITLNNGDLASGSDDKSIIIWDSTTYNIKRLLKNHTYYVLSLAQLPNDDLASASGDYTIKIWDPQSGILNDSDRSFRLGEIFSSLE